MEDAQIVELFFARSEDAISELDQKYGRLYHKLADNILERAGRRRVCERRLSQHMERDPAAAAGIPFGVCRHARPALFDHALSCQHGNETKQPLRRVYGGDRRIPRLPPAHGGALRGKGACRRRFLDTQSKENRVLFMRRYWYADSYADIGRLLGITESNARLRLMRMRKQLKTYLTEQEVMA